MTKSFSKVVSKGSTYFVGITAEKVLSFLLIPLYTGYLYPADFGIIALMDISVLLIVKLIDAPINSALIRFFYSPKYMDKNDVLLSSLLGLLLVKLLFLGIVYWFSTGIIQNLISIEDQGWIDRHDMLYIIRIYVLVVVFTPLASFFLSYIRMKHMAGLYTFVNLASLIISIGFIVYFLVVLEIGVLAIIYGGIIRLALQVVFILPRLLQDIKFRFSLAILKEPLKYGYPLILEGYSFSLLQFGDRYILKYFGTFANVGLYSFGYQIASLVQYAVVEPVKLVLGPVILEKEYDPVEQKQFIKDTCTYFYFIAIFLFLGISLFAKEFIMLIATKPEFWPSWKIVPIIALSYVLSGVGNFLGWGLIMRNKSIYLSFIVLISVLVNLVLNFLFVPIWGILGAAFATLIAYVVWNFMKIYYSAKFYQLYFDLKRMAVITFIGVAFFLLSVLITPHMSIALTFLIKLVLTIIYLPLFYFLGFFSSAELEYFGKILKIIRRDGLIKALKNLSKT